MGETSPLMPGGLVNERQRLRSYAFVPVTGHAELRLAELRTRSLHRPDMVTAALTESLEHIGGLEPLPERIRRLAVGDRQFLMRQLSIHLGIDRVWLTVECGQCGEVFEVNVAQSLMPTKEAPGGYPFARVDVGGRRLTFRVPDGQDQEAVVRRSEDSDEEAMLGILNDCLVAEDEGTGDTRWAGLSAADLELIEEALEDASPEVSTAVTTCCTACQAANEIVLDPGLWIDVDMGDLFSEVHTLAINYNWTEAEILAMPRDRRRRYVQMVERLHGSAIDPSWTRGGV